MYNSIFIHKKIVVNFNPRTWNAIVIYNYIHVKPKRL